MMRDEDPFFAFVLARRSTEPRNNAELGLSRGGGSRLVDLASRLREHLPGPVEQFSVQKIYRTHRCPDFHRQGEIFRGAMFITKSSLSFPRRPRLWKCVHATSKESGKLRQALAETDHGLMRV